MPSFRPLHWHLRLAVVTTAVWIVAALIVAFDYAEQCNTFGDRCWVNVARLAFTFLTLGVLPPLILWGVAWVRHGRSAVAEAARGASPNSRVNVADVLADRLRGTAIRRCKLCGRDRETRWAIYNENMSFFFTRRERTVAGFLCLACMSKTFAEFEAKTLVFTWWGLIGLFLGPAYVITNAFEYIKHCFFFAKKALIK